MSGMKEDRIEQVLIKSEVDIFEQLDEYIYAQG